VNLLIVNPRACVGRAGALWQRARAELLARGAVEDQLATAGGGRDIERAAERIQAIRPPAVITAGGDGTVSAAVQAIIQSGVAPRPALAILPLGTANNVARSLGLLSFRHHGVAAVERAVAAVASERERAIDLGQVGERTFIGSFALGMDADILVTRNRWQRRLRLGRRLGGYPLYLLSCALHAARPHGGTARLQIDDGGSAHSAFPIPHSAFVYNLLVTNVPIYAGEFRFDADNTCDDGRLDLHLFRGALDYLRRYPQAWRRHVHYTRGEPVTPPLLTRVRTVRVEFEQPVAGQLDGEEGAPAATYEIRTLPQALRVRVPA
jgi:diacylglycerol kinase family enzyme